MTAMMPSSGSVNSEAGPGSEPARVVWQEGSAWGVGVEPRAEPGESAVKIKCAPLGNKFPDRFQAVRTEPIHVRDDQEAVGFGGDFQPALADHCPFDGLFIDHVTIDLVDQQCAHRAGISPGRMSFNLWVRKGLFSQSCIGSSGGGNGPRLCGWDITRQRHSSERPR